jgi:indolepyruvate ferredoxin oxidoreductase beta subunit
VGSRKVANLVMLASAVAASNGTSFGLRGAIGTDELVRAMEACVKPAFVALNRAAIDTAIARVGAPSVN